MNCETAFKAIKRAEMYVEDMAGLLTQSASYELISALKKALKIPVYLHCHCTVGLAVAAY